MSPVAAHAAEARALRLFRKASIPYEHYFIQLYAAFNSWYGALRPNEPDARVLEYLVRHAELFADRIPLEVRTRLRPYMFRLYVITQHNPQQGYSWSGCLDDPYDYVGLLWFWYAVRCDVVHATQHVQQGIHEYRVKLAFETLQACLPYLVQAGPNSS